MKIAIIQFSPSGNTLQISQMIKNELESRGQEVQLIDITRAQDFFLAKDPGKLLLEKVKIHDVLIVGSPVYAHHLQYHVQDLIKALPEPNEFWGKYAIPFVTYGGISSGVALKEAGKLLKKSGRLVHAGMKISASHKMTRAFLPEEFNQNKPDDSVLPRIIELADRILQLESAAQLKFNSKALDYNGFETTLKAALIFKEKEWHKKRYPNISINELTCTGCGNCVKNCPVLHLFKEGNTISENSQSPCIHCLNCVVGCAKNAISLWGDLEKGKKFMGKMIEKNGNKEQPETAVYPIH